MLPLFCCVFNWSSNNWNNKYLLNDALFLTEVLLSEAKILAGEMRSSWLPTSLGGVIPYKSDGGARREFLRTPLKGTRILFYGRVPNSFPPLRGTNSTTTNYITGTAKR